MLVELSIFISVLPLLILIYYFLKLVIKQLNKTITLDDTKYVVGIFFVTISIQFIKKINWPESFHKYTMRPNAACDCDYFSMRGPAKENTPGFPSGHMGTTSFFCINNILDLLNGSNPYKYLIIGFNILFLVVMGWSRMYKKCHNLIQVIAGTIYGSFIGYNLYNIKLNENIINNIIKN
jgi:membrane-associated phospholipid phosphatase